MSNEEIFTKLRQEMLDTRQRRFQYQIGKIASIATYIGIGVLFIEKTKTPFLFYVLPFIAVAFDYLILGESFVMRRLSVFIRKEKHHLKDSEYNWENFVKLNPDNFSKIGVFIVTMSSAISSIFILIFSSNYPILDWFKDGFNFVWFVSVSISISSIRFIESKLAQKKWVFEQQEHIG